METSGHSAGVYGASNSLTFRLRLQNQPGMLGRVLRTIGETGGSIGAVEIVRVEERTLVRDVTVYAADGEQARQIEEALCCIDGVELVETFDRTFALHHGGKIEVTGTTKISAREQLSMAYTPGVARVCRAIHDDPQRAYRLTVKGNLVAVVTDGTAVLGLGDIGPEAALPVMEGKAQLFKEFAGVNAFPVCLRTTDPDEIVATVKRLAPVFGGVNLEDIAAPRCFEVERRLKEELDIPVFHDDQHGTAVVTLAALINALKLVEKRPEDLKVVISGVGASGTATTQMLRDYGIVNLIGVDSQGALFPGRDDLSEAKQRYAEQTNPNGERGRVHDVIEGADVFIGLSVPDLLEVDDLRKMARDPIVFAMANPDPEIQPEKAWDHVAVMATGRSDYANQINNVLCFPGIFQGALRCHATDINEPMKQAAAKAIAATIEDENLMADYIIPSVFDARVVRRVSEAVQEAARDSGVARDV